jgi:hypothetical protein
MAGLNTPSKVNIALAVHFPLKSFTFKALPKMPGMKGASE